MMEKTRHRHGFRPLAQIRQLDTLNKAGELERGKPELHYAITDMAGNVKELCDPQGQVQWRSEQGLWQELYQWRLERSPKQYLEEAILDPLHCDLRHQGQIVDEETGLYYNRHRYYDPHICQYLSPDPIGLAGGTRPQAYVHNPLEWVEPLGLNSTVLNKNIGGVNGDRLSAHHVIPVKIWNDNNLFLTDIGLGGRRDSVENGILIPSSEKAFKEGVGKGMPVYHSSKHDAYSKNVSDMLLDIQNQYDLGILSKDEARLAIRKMQMQLKQDIWSGNVSRTCKGRLN